MLLFAHLYGDIISDSPISCNSKFVYYAFKLTKHSEIWNISLTGYQAALDYFDTLPEDNGERDYALVDENAVNALNERANALDT